MRDPLHGSKRRHTTVLHRAPRGRKSHFPVTIFLAYVFAFGAIVMWWWQTSDQGDALEAASLSKPALVAVQQTRSSSQLRDEQRILDSLRQQAQNKVRYSPKYYNIGFPNGDVPANVGVSTDVVIRALRAVNVDLQELVYSDRVANPDRYPLERWANQKPDKSVDHRRVVNLAVFMKHHSRALPLTTWDSYRPGDIIFWRIGNGAHPDHVGVVLDEENADGVPLVAELNSQAKRISIRTPANLWPVRGHYRLHGAPAPGASIP